MSLIIVGEAATKIMDSHIEFAQLNSQVPWRSMRGMRNRIAHGYFEINLDLVWDTVQTALPELLNHLARIQKLSWQVMPIQPILKMGDPRLLRVAQPVKQFNTPELHALLIDLQDTMQAANGAGLAAPQIGVDLQVVIFGSGEFNPRYPDAPVVPRTVLINPVLTPLSDDEEEGWEGCLVRARHARCGATLQAFAQPRF